MQHLWNPETSPAGWKVGILRELSSASSLLLWTWCCRHLTFMESVNPWTFGKRMPRCWRCSCLLQYHQRHPNLHQMWPSKARSLIRTTDSSLANKFWDIKLLLYDFSWSLEKLGALSPCLCFPTLFSWSIYHHSLSFISLDRHSSSTQLWFCQDFLGFCVCHEYCV